MPVSTTHVAVGSLFGIGLVNGKANTDVIASIALSWLLTLPCAAVCAAAIYYTAVNL
jgi:PiT family inorganic phosphate transporter